MAQGVASVFDLDGVKKEIDRYTKLIHDKLNDTLVFTQASITKANEVLSSFGDVQFKISNKDEFKKYVTSLLNSLSELSSKADANISGGLLNGLMSDAKAAFNEIDMLILALDKIKSMSVSDQKLGKKEYATLLSERASLQEKLKTGSYEDELTGKTKKYSKKQIQSFVDQLALIEAEIKQRLTPSLKQAASATKLLSDTTKLLNDQQEKLYSTPQGALEYASNAKSQAEMEQAMKYLDAARKNIDVTTKEGLTLNDALIKKYSELKTAIEELEGKTKDQNTLVATESAKYARLLREIDKYKKVLEELRKTEAYKNGDAQARNAERDLQEEIRILEKRKDLYAANKESIKQATIQVAADTAREETEIIKREEAQRAKEKEDALRKARQRYAELLNEEEKLTAEFNRGYDVIDKYGDDSGSIKSAQAKIQQELSRVYQERRELEEEYQNELTDIQEKHQSERNKKALANAEALAKKQAQRAAEAEKRAAEETEKKRRTTRGAIEYAKEAKTIKELVQAYKYLDEAKKNVNISTKDGKKEFKDLSRKMEEVRGALLKYGVTVSGTVEKHKQLFNTGDQLRRMFTGLFSVSAIRRYISQVVNLRGEFELQQRSLQALLQNKDEADKLWNKTIQLAVRSPYNVKELVTYTKQLAAYRLETEKLHDTTKMLADISAGLGVDMQRLILAYGQVKAANYLRGTELRQFSEAGINVLGELSKYFTELEGRVVSVGDVFERVSKRMVSFADVEEVIKRVTSEGGAFYNMQEIQAETVKGMMSNLKDSIDIMVNEIGEKNEEFIKGAIKLAMELANNWQKIADVAGPISLALVGNMTLFNGRLIKTISSLGGVGKSLKVIMATLSSGTTVAKRFAATLGTTLAGSWLSVAAIIIGAIVSIVRHLTSAEREAKRFAKELQKIYNEDVSNLEKQVATFEDLVGRLKDVSEGSEEHKRIISQLNSQYGEYLGYLVTEKTTYDELANSIDDVTYSLTQRARANTLEKAYQKTSDKYLDDISDIRKVIEKEMLASGRLYATDKEGNTLRFIPTKAEIEDIFKLIEKRVQETGKAFTGFADIKDVLSEYTGKSVTFSGGFGSLTNADITELTESYLALHNALDTLEQDLNDVYSGGFGTAAYRREMTEFKNQIPQLQEELAKSNFGKSYSQLAENQVEEIQKEIERRRLFIEFTYTLKPESGNVETAVNKAIADWDKHSSVIKKFNEKIAQKLVGKDKNVINAVYQEQSTANTKGINQLLDEFVSGYKEQENEITRINGLKKEGAIYSQEENEELKKQLQNAKELKNAYYEAIKLLGGLDLLPENQKEAEKLKKSATLLEEMRREYEKQRILYSAGDAARMVRDSYEDAWSAVGGNINDITSTMLSDSNLLAKYIEDTLLPLVDLLPKKQQESVRQVLTNAKGGFETHAADEFVKQTNKAFKREVEKLFEQYELSVDLKNMKIPADFAEKLFGLETIDLKELRSRLEKMAPLFVGTDLENYYQEMLKKLGEMEDKDRKERIKKYLSYTRDAIGERAKIKLEELNKLQEIEDTFTEGEAKKRAQEGVRKESKEALNKYNWEQFKSSEIFAGIFNDLEQASEESIKYAIDQIRKYKKEWSDMPVTEAKEMIKRLNELEVALQMKGKPRENIASLVKDLEKAMKTMDISSDKRDSYAKLRDNLISSNINLEETNKGYEKEIENLEVLLQLYDEGKLVIGDLTDEQFELLGVMNNATVVEKKTFVDAIDKRKKQMETNNGLISSNDILLDKLKALSASYKEAEEMQQKWVSQVQDAYGAVKELVSVLGGIDETNEMWWDLGDQMINLISQGVSFYFQLKQMEVQATATGVAMNAAFGPIGWAVLALQAIVAIIKAISDNNQAKIDAQIDNHYKKVEDLQKEYEKLEKAIENAYNIQDLQRYNKELQNNIEEQKKHIAEAKAAAESGKDNEKNLEAAAEAQEKYDELVEQSAEKAKELFSEVTAGVFDDTWSAAEGFVDSWLEAYREVGDGMSGLTEHFEEEMQNVIKRQAAMQIVGSYVNLWRKQLEGIAEDGNFDISAYIKEIKKWLPALSADLEEYYKNMPFASSNELSGLQKGIQGITAEQADILAAYWNSVRFYMASVDQKFDIPLSTFMTDDTSVNPVLRELKNIATRTNDIYKLLDGVTTRGEGIKVLMQDV